MLGIEGIIVLVVFGLCVVYLMRYIMRGLGLSKKGGSPCDACGKCDPDTTPPQTPAEKKRTGCS